MERGSRFTLPTFSATRSRLAFMSVLTSLALLSPFVAAAADRGAGPRASISIPFLELLDLDGGKHTFDPSAPETSATIFFFFEPRSAASLMEMKFLARLYPKLKEKGIAVVAVEASGTYGDELALQRRRLFADAPFSVICDPGYRLSRLFGVRDIPSTFVVDPGGDVLGVLEGFSGRGGVDLTRMIVASRAAGGGDDAAGALDSSLPAAPDQPGKAVPVMLGVGDRVPPLSAVDLEGRALEPDWSSGDTKVHVVFFWGAMCLPCMREMTYLEEIYSRTKNRGLRILAVQATAMSPERTAAVMKRYERVYPPPSFPIVPDSDGAIRRIFGVKEGGPATFFVDRNGTVTFAIDDFALGYEDTMATKIERALQMGSETIALSTNADSERKAAPPAPQDGPLQQMYEDNLTRGDFYYSTKRYGKALNCYLKALSIEPAAVHVLCRVADIYERKGKLSEARRQWEKVLRYDSGHTEALRRLRELRERGPGTPSG